MLANFFSYCILLQAVLKALNTKATERMVKQYIC